MNWLDNLPIGKLQLDTATVLNVTGNKCKVKSLSNGKVFFKCSIGAVLEPSENHLSLYPKQGSTVVIGIFEKENTAVVLGVSQVERLYYRTNVSLPLSRTPMSKIFTNPTC